MACSNSIGCFMLLPSVPSSPHWTPMTVVPFLVSASIVWVKDSIMSPSVMVCIIWDCLLLTLYARHFDFWIYRFASNCSWICSGSILSENKAIDAAYLLPHTSIAPLISAPVGKVATALKVALVSFDGLLRLFSIVSLIIL